MRLSPLKKNLGDKVQIASRSLQSFHDHKGHFAFRFILSFHEFYIITVVDCSSIYSILMSTDIVKSFKQLT